jgi:hypothetical protein
MGSATASVPLREPMSPADKERLSLELALRECDLQEAAIRAEIARLHSALAHLGERRAWLASCFRLLDRQP